MAARERAGVGQRLGSLGPAAPGWPLLVWTSTLSPGGKQQQRQPPELSGEGAGSAG